jgi:hypothetical protein
MDLLGTWGKRTQDLLGGARRSLLGDDLPPEEKRAATVGTFGPSVLEQTGTMLEAQKKALKRGGIRDMLHDPVVVDRAVGVASNLDFTGALRSHIMPNAYGRPGGKTEILERPNAREIAEMAIRGTPGPGVRVILNKEGRPDYAWSGWDAIHDDVRKFLGKGSQGGHYHNDIVSDMSDGFLRYKNLNFLDPPPPMTMNNYVRHMRGSDLPLFSWAEERNR